MASVWLRSELSDEIMKSDEVFKETKNIFTDMLCDKIDLVKLLDNMGGVLTHKEPENRQKGMRFFTKLLKELPKDYLSEIQVKFISKFYIDRLKDNHRVIPTVLIGYLAILNMVNYKIENSAEFFTTMFKEIACQSQLREDRHNIYLILKTVMDMDLDYMKKLGPDFVYGVISAIDGERDPRNLLFIFSILPKFLVNVPLGHLVEEMFEVISCYYPIDFHPSPDDPAAVTRQELADALCPCLCAIPEFGEQCLVLLVEKLDSSLRLAKIDSLQLLKESCNTFNPASYEPFLKALWSSLHREIHHKTDDELKMAAHEVLSVLVKCLSTTANTNKTFENFVKGVIISMQAAIAEASTVAQFTQATRVLLTTANASKESCIITARIMIPATVAYYNFKTSPKLQISSLDFLGDQYDLAKHWNVLNEIGPQLVQIPEQCLAAVSEQNKEYQIGGFKTLIRVSDIVESDLIVPFVEVLTYNIHHCQDNDLLSISVKALHAIARKYPSEIMQLVVKGKCDLKNLTSDKTGLHKRLNLLCSLASIDEFTKVIIEEMLLMICKSKEDAETVVTALNVSISNSSLYSEEKLTQIESDHGLVNSVLTWLENVISQDCPHDALIHGYDLIATTVGSLPEDKQLSILEKHTPSIITRSTDDELYFLMLESLYESLHLSVYNSSFEEIMIIALNHALRSETEIVKNKASILIAHFLNKAEYAHKFEILYDTLKNFLGTCRRDDEELCPKLITLYGWVAKALIMRGSDLFTFWLQKILIALTSPPYSVQAAESIKLIMTDSPNYLNSKHHCRISLLYKQRMFQSFNSLTESQVKIVPETKDMYLLSWAYILEKAPKSLMMNEVNKIAPIVYDSLQYDNQELLAIMLDILIHIVRSSKATAADSLQSILPRLVHLSTYEKSMVVRIKSLECLFEIAHTYPTVLLLPFKPDVLLQLAPSLDDQKRLVRNMAVRARTRWFLIGAPGEE